MAESKDSKSLEMRLTRLENAIAKLSEARKPVDVSAEEMKAYHKVRSSLVVDYCISECARCAGPRCYCGGPCVVSCISVCINECGGGPCILGRSGGSGGFQDLGG
jgi:hypothetical protein